MSPSPREHCPSARKIRVRRLDGLWLRRRVAPKGRSLDRPGRRQLAGALAVRDRGLAKNDGWGQGRAVRRKRPANSCGFPGLRLLRITGGISLPPPGVGLLREDCPKEVSRAHVLPINPDIFFNQPVKLIDLVR
jgi:hypothetical protein